MRSYCECACPHRSLQSSCCRTCVPNTPYPSPSVWPGWPSVSWAPSSQVSELFLLSLHLIHSCLQSPYFFYIIELAPSRLAVYCISQWSHISFCRTVCLDIFIPIFGCHHLAFGCQCSVLSPLHNCIACTSLLAIVFFCLHGSCVCTISVCVFCFLVPPFFFPILSPQIPCSVPPCILVFPFFSFSPLEGMNYPILSVYLSTYCLLSPLPSLNWSTVHIQECGFVLSCIGFFKVFICSSMYHTKYLPLILFEKNLKE